MKPLFKNKKSLKLAILVLLFSSLALTSCNLSYFGISSNDEGAMRLEISINSSRTVLPGSDTEISYYEITGTGPNENEFTQTSTGTEIYIYDLAVGEWNVSITAMSSDDYELGFGETTVIVQASEQSDASVTVLPFEGTGALALSVLWDEEDVSSPEITAVLRNSAGVEQDLTFSVGASSATFQDDEINSGYYTLSIQMKKNGTVVSGIVEAVRIMQNYMTTGNFSFEDINNPTGDIALTVIVEMDEPLEPVISGAEETIAYGSIMTVTASVIDDGGDTIVFSWFVNGSLEGEGESITFGSDLRWGTYRLDLVASTSDGSRSGSVSHTFTVE